VQCLRVFIALRAIELILKELAAVASAAWHPLMGRDDANRDPG
jgi:hypothetical protein